MPFPKTSGKRLSTKRQADARIDKAESAKVRKRSEGQCEVVELGFSVARAGVRCPCRAVHVHHELGGNGTRGRKESALACNKKHVCVECHLAIHAHKLVKDGEFYRRVN